MAVSKDRQPNDSWIKIIVNFVHEFYAKCNRTVVRTSMPAGRLFLFKSLPVSRINVNIV